MNVGYYRILFCVLVFSVLINQLSIKSWAEIPIPNYPGHDLPEQNGHTWKNWLVDLWVFSRHEKIFLSNGTYFPNRILLRLASWWLPTVLDQILWCRYPAQSFDFSFAWRKLVLHQIRVEENFLTHLPESKTKEWKRCYKLATSLSVSLLLPLGSFLGFFGGEGWTSAPFSSKDWIEESGIFHFLPAI